MCNKLTRYICPFYIVNLSLPNHKLIKKTYIFACRLRAMPLQWTRKKFHIRNFFTHTGPRPADDITRSMFGHALVVHLADISTTVQSINQSKTLFNFGFVDSKIANVSEEKKTTK